MQPQNPPSRRRRRRQGSDKRPAADDPSGSPPREPRIPSSSEGSPSRTAPCPPTPENSPMCAPAPLLERCLSSESSNHGTPRLPPSRPSPLRGTPSRPPLVPVDDLGNLGLGLGQGEEDPELLNEQMLVAASMQDFALAARLKERKDALLLQVQQLQQQQQQREESASPHVSEHTEHLHDDPALDTEERLRRALAREQRLLPLVVKSGG
eukprot:Hpha_TRINITY_DN31402_c0_g1::TRINITY_DN31402_c0_g1_i1::g.145422::m.145422